MQGGVVSNLEPANQSCEARNVAPDVALPLIWLASRSPRRRELLTAAGLRHVAEHPGLEDSELVPGAASPREWVAALAYLKASAGAAMAAAAVTERAWVLGADTACVAGDSLIGTPRDLTEARAMMRAFRETEHEVVTGVALIEVMPGVAPTRWSGALPVRRSLFSTSALVRWGMIDDAEIERYLASGQWQGKAGGYNLRERLEAGWPITFAGDPTGVMGLPMDALLRKLALLRRVWADERNNQRPAAAVRT